MNTLISSTPIIIFLSIGISCLLFVCSSFLLGSGHDIDHDHDHDFGSAHELSSISIFSPKVIGIFGVAFGGGGTIASIYGLGILSATLIGLTSGVSIATLAYLAMKLFYKQQVNSLITDDKIVGCYGQVTTRIPAAGCGEVTFVSQGQSLTRLATCCEQTELKVGTRIKIISVGGNALQVEAI